MPSVIGWLDQSEVQQRRMREVIALFAESGTIDDIGIGVVRDAFSDLLFPGLSTVQTRVRYFLFVPWVYQRLEAERISSAAADARARQWEIELIDSLLRGTDEDGIIGSSARDKLKQLPSAIYWSGLQTYGIRLFKGTRRDYFRELDRFGRTVIAHRAEGDDPLVSETYRWHPNLPAAPDDLWTKASLQLRHDDAAYLRERIVMLCPDTLLAHLLIAEEPIDETLRFPWDAVDVNDLEPVLALRLRMAQYFSETIHGASLLYNLLLAEAAQQRNLPLASDREATYRSGLEEWQDLMNVRRPAFTNLSRDEFWKTVDDSGWDVPLPACHFIDTWLDAVNAGTVVADSAHLRQAIVQRERTLKKGLSRLANPRALENWQGDSGLGRLAYRWTEGRRAVNDIASGLATD